MSTPACSGGHIGYCLQPVVPQAQIGQILYFRYINHRLNAEQKQAVMHIVAVTSRPAPYLVFGPPGTGKTMVIIEAVQQVNVSRPAVQLSAVKPLSVHRSLELVIPYSCGYTRTSDN